MVVAYSDVEDVFANGGRGAVAPAYNMWGALVYTITLRGTGEPEVAAELTRRTFLSVWHDASRPAALPLKSRLVLTARTLVHAHLAERGATVAEQAAADGIIDRVVVRDELTAMAEPTRSVMLQALSAGGDVAQAAERVQLPRESVELLVRDGVNTLVVGLAGSRGI
jgi:RNA polymerase sigma-70 factor, ECF subfamily